MDSLNTLNNSTSDILINMEDSKNPLRVSQLSSLKGLVSVEVVQVVEYVLNTGIIGIICLLGIIGNSISLAVFHRQGYKDTINISLSAIAIWDLIKCISGFLCRFPIPIRPLSPGVHVTLLVAIGISVGYASPICTYVSSVLAGYISVERCLCVSLPFMVKYLLTPKVVTAVMIILSVITFGSCSVIYPLYEVFLVYDPKYNMTILDGKFSAAFFNFPFLLKMYNVLGFFWPSLSFGVQIVCTVIITYHLRKSRKFRESNNPKQMSTRERQVTRMLLVVISCYIVTMLPRLAMNIAKLVVPGFFGGLFYNNLYHLCMWSQFVFDFVNASVNSIIYYFMTSQYKATLWQMFHLRNKLAST